MALGQAGNHPVYLQHRSSNITEALEQRGTPLDAERILAQQTLLECDQIACTVNQTNTYPTLTLDTALWALARTDHTTLTTDCREDAQHMHRMMIESILPYKMRSVCMRPDSALIKAFIESIRPYLERGERFKLTFVSNYPHGDWHPDTIRKTLDKIAQLTHGIAGLSVDIDSVLNIGAWMQGDRTAVERSLQADAYAKELGFTWKLILSVLAHAYGDKNKQYGGDNFASIFEAGMLGLHHGADCLKTSTGNSAKEPYHYYDSKDVGKIEHALGMLAALRVFNKDHNAERWPKWSGGNVGLLDVAILRHASEQFLGTDMLDKVAFGTSPDFRHSLLKSMVDLALQNNVDIPFDPRYLNHPDIHGIYEIASESHPELLLPSTKLNLPPGPQFLHA